MKLYGAYENPDRSIEVFFLGEYPGSISAAKALVIQQFLETLKAQKQNPVINFKQQNMPRSAFLNTDYSPFYVMPLIVLTEKETISNLEEEFESLLRSTFDKHQAAIESVFPLTVEGKKFFDIELELTKLDMERASLYLQKKTNNPQYALFIQRMDRLQAQQKVLLTKLPFFS